jgi:large subunit ribosomal protein L17
LFRDVAAKLEIVQVDTRIKVGNRLGDNADMAMIELVDFNELYTGKKVKKAKTDAVEKLRKQMRLLKSVAEADTTTDAAE